MTSAGRQRWRCPSCGTSSTVRRDGDAAALREFLGWLMSKGSQLEMPGQGRSFRRRTAGFWEVWPMPVPDGEWHRVLYVDGIWLARDLVVLICRSDERVVSWYMARSETSRAWSALMDPIPAPDVVVSDGGTGFASAVRAAGRERASRGASSTRSARSGGTRPRAQGSRPAWSPAGSRAACCTSRRSNRPSCGSSAACSGAASGPTSSRTRR